MNKAISQSQPRNQAKSGKTTPDQVHFSAPAAFIGTVLIVLDILGITFLTKNHASDTTVAIYAIVVGLLAVIAFYCIKVANQWEKAVVMRLGHFNALKGPGLFFLAPILDTVANWIDQRVTVTPFNAEKTLTKDTVPVDVDAVLFWLVWDGEKAALEVQDYRAAISWAAQTALREIIGQMTLADILTGRSKMDAELQRIIDERTTPWGVTVQSVEIRDVIIPPDLEDAMSRQAQAERERQARVILGESEMQIASSFAEAARNYENNPTALHLRAMNMLFEGLKQKGALVIVPSSAVDTMNLGSMTGMVALSQTQAAKPTTPPAAE